MTDRKPAPGISRDQRISEEGLQRLERQLRCGAQISDMVLAQWIKRYGAPVIALLQRYDRYPQDTE
jgi:hypothetical protein